jgi:hypothetical protein
MHKCGDNYTIVVVCTSYGLPAHWGRRTLRTSLSRVVEMDVLGNDRDERARTRAATRRALFNQPFGEAAPFPMTPMRAPPEEQNTPERSILDKKWTLSGCEPDKRAMWT